MTRTILIVDDSEVDRVRIRKLLRDSGYVVVTAENGAEAIEAAKQNKPHAILMDVNMPGMDGFAATRALRADSETKDIPVVLVTMRDQKADRAWAKMLGAKGFVTKPFSDEQLLEKVGAL